MAWGPLAGGGPPFEGVSHVPARACARAPGRAPHPQRTARPDCSARPRAEGLVLPWVQRPAPRGLPCWFPKPRCDNPALQHSSHLLPAPPTSKQLGIRSDSSSERAGSLRLLAPASAPALVQGAAAPSAPPRPEWVGISADPATSPPPAGGGGITHGETRTFLPGPAGMEEGTVEPGVPLWRGLGGNGVQLIWGHTSWRAPALRDAT